jgi:hypothetical protein
MMISFKRSAIFCWLLIVHLLIPRLSPAQTTTEVNEAIFSYPMGAEAVRLICTDPADDFFDWIQPLDMRIQMRVGNDEYPQKGDLLKAYKAHLKDDLTEFSKEEIERIDRILKECHRAIKKLNPTIFPDTVHMIKIKGNCYGPSAFYTRQNAILIPTPMLTVMDDKTLTEVMYHEIFHIISRYNDDLRKELYNLVGYTEPGPGMDIPKDILEQWLLNPDGLAYPVIIEISGPEGPVVATPVIYTSAEEYYPQRPGFFQYLQFALFEVEMGENGPERIITDGNGSSTLSEPWVQKAHLDVIKDNTQYIIHPDEILADNFSFLFRSAEENSKLSEEGTKLLGDLQSLIRNW